jgi:predicted HNH restriction endonuclease
MSADVSGSDTEEGTEEGAIIRAIHQGNERTAAALAGCLREEGLEVT